MSLLGDPAASVRSIAAEILWKINIIDFTIKFLRDDYKQNSPLGKMNLTMTSHEAMAGLYLLDLKAPTSEERMKYRKLVREIIGINLS